MSNTQQTNPKPDKGDRANPKPLLCTHALRCSDFRFHFRTTTPLREYARFCRTRFDSFVGIPLGRWGEPEDVAKAVLFLASDDSSYVNAVELMVDGGMTGDPFGAPILRG